MLRTFEAKQDLKQNIARGVTITLTEYWQAMLDLIEDMEIKEHQDIPEKGFEEKALAKDNGYTSAKKSLKEMATIGVTLETLGRDSKLKLFTPGLAMINLEKNAQFVNQLTGDASRVLLSEYSKLLKHLADKKVTSENKDLQKGLASPTYVPCVVNKGAGYDDAEKSHAALDKAIKAYDVQAIESPEQKIVKDKLKAATSRYNTHIAPFKLPFQSFKKTLAANNVLISGIGLGSQIESIFEKNNCDEYPENITLTLIKKQQDAIPVSNPKNLHECIRLALADCDPEKIYKKLESCLSTESKKKWHNRFSLRLFLASTLFGTSLTKGSLSEKTHNKNVLCSILTAEITNNLKIMKKDLSQIITNFHTHPTSLSAIQSIRGAEISQYKKNIFKEYLKNIGCHDECIIADCMKLDKANYPLAKIEFFMQLMAYQKNFGKIKFISELLSQVLEKNIPLMDLLKSFKEKFLPWKVRLFNTATPANALYMRLTKIQDIHVNNNATVTQFQLTDKGLIEVRMKRWVPK